jgi:chorismate synthase
MSNTFGECFRVLTFGESHGRAMGVVIDGVRPGLDFDLTTIQQELDRRRPGQNRLVSPRQEKDRVEVLSGVFEGKTLGTPIALLVPNTDQDPKAYEALRDVFRPGHADYTILKKYGIRDHRGGGRSSARETVARVAAGALAKRELAKEEIHIWAYTVQVGTIKAESVDFGEIEQNPVRCPDKEAAKRMEERIRACQSQGDSVGGIVEVVARGVPPGFGDPVFKKLDAEIAGALMSIGGVKGVEIGEGFQAASMQGSEHNDQMDRRGFKTNHAGGVLGGISTGEEIRARIAVKPTPSIEKEQATIDVLGRERRISVSGRHDACICPRIVPVAEAMMALVLYDALLSQKNLEDTAGDLECLRGQIDSVDHRLIQLLVERERISQAVGRLKKEKGLAIRDQRRETDMVEQRVRWAEELGLSGEIIRRLFPHVLKTSRQIQEK